MISRWAYLQNRLVYLTVAALMLYGLVSYFTLPAREDPHITIREALVEATAPGFTAERMERLVTRTLEEKIREVPEIEQLRSITQPGRTVIHVDILDKYFGLDDIWADVRNKVDEAERDLPEGVRMVRVNDDFGDVAVVTVALTGDEYAPAELFELAKYSRDRLFGVKGTKKVEMVGQREERAYIEIDEVRLPELGLSPADLAAQLRARNVLAAGGTLRIGDRRLPVIPTGSFDDLDALRGLLIERPGAEAPLALSEVAEIRRGYQEPAQRLAYVNGEAAIVLSVSMLPDQRVLEYAPRVRARIAEIEATLPIGMELRVVTDQSEQVANTVYGVTLNVGETLAIVLAVVILFLGMRTGLIVGSIVPAVMLVTLAVMGVFGMALQRMSLATLVIALGLLVDNGIVVAEDFKRRLEEGASREQALEGVGTELASPLLSSTLTTVLVFLPLMLAQHVAGEFTRSISLVILISLLSSWVLAMTFTPLLCHRFIQVDTTGGKDRFDFFAAVNRHYEWFLHRVLKHPAVFLGVMALAMAGAMAGMAKAPKKFFPNSDRTQVLAYLDLEPSAAIEATEAALLKVQAVLEDEERFPYVKSHAGYVGFGGPRFVLALAPIDPAPNRAFMVVDVDGAEHMDATIEELRAGIAEAAPEISAQVKRMFLGPSDSSKIDVQVKGPDMDVLKDFSARIESILREVPGSTDLRTDWEGDIASLIVDVDQARSARAGVTSTDVARALARGLAGFEVAELREGDDVFPIVLRPKGLSPEHPLELSTLTVSGRFGPVSLSQVADVRIETRRARIAREDLERTVTVEARNLRMTAQDMVPVVNPKLDALREELPPGHVIEYDGVVEDSAGAQGALQANVPLCLGLMLLLLVQQFRSYRRPFIIMGTIPLLVIGAALGLHVMGAKLGFMVILGLYSLAGIIINNGIVLIDRIEIERADPSVEPHEAMMQACSRRLRPIVMTTVTTILGLLPLIVFEDALFYGMASVMAFGLLIGTVLTLGVVPAAYAIFFGIRAPREASK